MKKLLLVGGGHTHLHVIQKLKDNPITDVEVTLISPSQFQYYSDMFGAYTEGLYDKSQIRIDLETLAKNSKINWLQGAVTSIDSQQKMVLTSNGDIHSFDAISFNIGSLTADTDIPGVVEYAYRIKPNYHFVDTISEVHKSDKVVIVGGGAAAIEISLSLQSWRKKNHVTTPVTLVSPDRLLQEKRKKISDKIEEIVFQKGINFIKNEEITSVKHNKIITSLHNEIYFDKLLWLAGPNPPGLFSTSNLPVDDQGYLKVEDTLQVKKYPFMFGAGDCVSFMKYPNIDKAGVNAVKQGAVLFKNLKGFFETGEGELYTPQKNDLSIMSLGDKGGFLNYKKHLITGRLAWYLKKWIDTRYSKLYKD
ncbi:NAD(P)/FAD-dependent oxidoreductase [Salinibacillus xinjiangensis]|uniref:Pyridine nucleotide-disulfide oxidoreductase n=1 Tax=Salinibacillus xinjiangensis TaxID=1229268 RepID=A0A6G1X537_9BACI|nr:FAD-dependent oxidoreductase [Salinibacillus xinjiangensis]MRG85990.1 pyridine nucleotide-disulfide oxidoreductase [Salinibacillus xinjiangensis]